MPSSASYVLTFRHPAILFPAQRTTSPFRSLSHSFPPPGTDPEEVQRHRTLLGKNFPSFLYLCAQPHHYHYLCLPKESHPACSSWALQGAELSQGCAEAGTFPLHVWFPPGVPCHLQPSWTKTGAAMEPSPSPYPIPGSYGDSKSDSKVGWRGQGCGGENESGGKGMYTKHTREGKGEEKYIT